MATVLNPNNQSQNRAWQAHICEQIRPHLPEFNKPQECLDFLCGDGSLTIELFDELPKGSRLIGLDDNRESLSKFHGKIFNQKNDIFLRKQSLNHHPFGASVFDLVWGIWSLHHPGNLTRILRTLYPILKPGGTLICATPLHGSFSELYRFIQEKQNPEQESFIFAARNEFPSIASCEKAVQESGLTFQKATEASFSFQTELQNLQQSFLVESLYGLWAGTASTIANVLEESVEASEQSQLEVSIQFGVFCATKS